MDYQTLDAEIVDAVARGTEKDYAYAMTLLRENVSVLEDEEEYLQYKNYIEGVRMASLSPDPA